MPVPVLVMILLRIALLLPEYELAAIPFVVLASKRLFVIALDVALPEKTIPLCVSRKILFPRIVLSAPAINTLSAFA